MGELNITIDEMLDEVLDTLSAPSRADGWVTAEDFYERAVERGEEIKDKGVFMEGIRRTLKADPDWETIEHKRKRYFRKRGEG